MKIKKGKQIILICLILIISPLNLLAANPSDLLISEVQITGGPGKTNNDFVKIYNSTDSPINLKDYRLVKRTKTGTTDTTLKSWTTEILIPSHNYHLWANSTDSFADNLKADSSTSQTISEDNGVAIRFGKEDEGQIIDSVGWGASQNIFNEISPYPQNPTANQILKRQNNQDTNNNAQDFYIFDPNPSTITNTTNPDINDSAESDTIANNTPNNQSSSISSSTDSSNQSITNDLVKSKTITNNQLFITEILPNPVGADNSDNLLKEFIELYNAGDEIINLTNWRLTVDDKLTFQFTNNLDGSAKTLPAKTFLVLYREQTNLVLANDGGEIKLFEPTKTKARQTIKYKKAEAGLSYVDQLSITEIKDWQPKLNDPWAWTATPTPDEINIFKAPNVAPVATINIEGDLIVGQPILFDGSDSYDTNLDKLNFNWELDDSTSNLTSPEHTFFQPGKYQIKLTVSDGQLADTATKSITIVDPNNKITAKQVSAIAKSSKTTTTKVNKTTAKTAAKKIKTTKSTKTTSIKTSKKKIVQYLKLDNFASINQLTSGDYFKIKGIVAVKPGDFNQQYFYLLQPNQTITNNKAGVKIAANNFLPDWQEEPINALQIYNYKKDWPKVEIGDLIEVSGQLAINQTGYRLKTKTKADIKIISSKNLIEPIKKTCDEIDQTTVGQLIVVEGEITSKKGSTLYLDDGKDELEIYLKKNTGLVAKNFNLNDQLKIIGLVEATKTGFRLLPRNEQDVVRLTTSTPAIQKPSDLIIDQTSSEENKLIYYLVIIFVGSVVGVVIIFRKKWLIK